MQDKANFVYFDMIMIDMSYVYVVFFSVFLTLHTSAFSHANIIFGFGKIQDDGSKMA